MLKDGSLMGPDGLVCWYSAIDLCMAGFAGWGPRSVQVRLDLPPAAESWHKGIRGWGALLRPRQPRCNQSSAYLSTCSWVISSHPLLPPIGPHILTPTPTQIHIQAWTHTQACKYKCTHRHAHTHRPTLDFFPTRTVSSV